MIEHGPLSKAYKFRSLHYNLAYQAFCSLAVELEEDNDKMIAFANEFGVTADELFMALEELYTDNADPDNPETD